MYNFTWSRSDILCSTNTYTIQHLVTHLHIKLYHVTTIIHPLLPSSTPTFLPSTEVLYIFNLRIMRGHIQMYLLRHSCRLQGF